MAKRRRRESPPARTVRKEAELEVEEADRARERTPPPTPAGAVNAMDELGKRGRWLTENWGKETNQRRG
jgi:hypothetical protein